MRAIIGTPSISAQQLVDAAHPAGSAGGEHDAGNPAGGRTGGRRALARLGVGLRSPSNSPAHPHGGDVLAGHRHPGHQALQHPVEAVQPGRAR